MSQALDFKAVLIALFPDGKLWDPKPDEGFDKYLEATAENIQLIYERLAAAAKLRDPRLTPYLSDLEKEYRTIPEAVLTEAERRVQLANIKYAPLGTGSAQYLQDRLQENGFDLVVHENSPAIDPRILADISYQMMADGDHSFAGHEDAFAGEFGGELIVNQDMYDQDIEYEIEADGDYSFAGHELAVAGYFNDLYRNLIEYSLNMLYEYWSSVFFVAGDFSQWIPLRDWNMEKPGNVNWVSGPASLAVKDIFAIPPDSDEKQSEYRMQADVYDAIPDINVDKDGINYGGVNTEDLYGLAMSFDGTYAQFTQDAFSYTEFTYEVIAKINESYTGVASGIPIFGDENISIYGTGLYWRFDIVSMRIGLGSGIGSELSAGFKAEIGRYYHIVGTWKNGESIKLYIDGKLYDNNVYLTGTIDQTIHLYSAGVPSLSEFGACEVAYATYYDELKDQDWVNARYFDVMRYGVRRLQVSAMNNTALTQLSPYPYDPDVLHDYCMYLYPGIALGKGIFDLVGDIDWAQENTTNINSIYGRGLSFNGTTSSAGGVFVYTSDEITIEITAKVDNYPGAVDSFIIGSTDQAGDAMSLHGIEARSTSNIRAYIYMAGDNRYFTGNYAMTTGVYHHIVMAWKSGETLKLYVDGSLVAQSGVVTGVLEAFSGVIVGKDNASPTYLDCDAHRVTLYKTRKELAYIQSRYNEMLERKVCDLTMYNRQFGFGPSGYSFTTEDITTNQHGDPIDIVDFWSKYGRSLIFNGASSILNLYLNHPVMASNDCTYVIVFKKAPGIPGINSFIISNDVGFGNTMQGFNYNKTANPDIYNLQFFAGYGTGYSSVDYFIDRSVFEDYTHIVCTRYYDSTDTYLDIYINGDYKNTWTIIGNAPDLTAQSCIVGRNSTNYANGELAHLKLFTDVKDATWVTNDYNDFIATDMTNGSYAEQILDIPITDSRDMTGVAWGDGVGARPYLMVQDPSTLEWSTVWEGTADATMQHFAATAPNGMSAIRLYNGLSEDGFVSFDDISVIDPQVIRGQVPASRKDRLKQLILRHKPLGSWCVLIADYV